MSQFEKCHKNCAKLEWKDINWAYRVRGIVQQSNYKRMSLELENTLSVFILCCCFCCFMSPKELFTAYSKHTVCPSINPSVHPSYFVSSAYISYILGGRNPKFDSWMYLGMTDCCILFWGHCDLDFDLCLSFQNNNVQSISHVFFEVGIPNLVCGCIMGWGSAA